MARVALLLVGLGLAVSAQGNWVYHTPGYAFPKPRRIPGPPEPTPDEVWELKPTVIGTKNFNAYEDAARAHDALGLGATYGTVQWDKLDDLIANRDLPQRLYTNDVYRKIYGQNLAADANKKAAGVVANYDNALDALYKHPSILQSEYINAICTTTASFVAKYKSLGAVMCGISNAAMRDLVHAYASRYGASLWSLMESCLNDDTKSMMKTLVDAKRNESFAVDDNLVAADVAAMRALGSSDMSKLTEVLTKRSLQHVRKFLREYTRQTGRSIKDYLSDGNTYYKSSFAAFNWVVKKLESVVPILKHDLLYGCAVLIQNPPEYYAEEIFTATNGPGTTELALTFSIVTRSDVDLGNIKDVYTRKYGQNLAANVLGDTSGGYQRTLKILIK